MRKLIACIGVCLLLVSCIGKKSPAPAAPPAAPAFPMAKVPGVISDPAEAAAWMASHFFDEVTTVTALDSVSLEHAMGTWASILAAIPHEVGQQAMHGYLDHFETLPAPDAAALLNLTEKYLYDPNSPVRNEDLYGTLAKGLSTSKATPDSLRMHFAYLADKCARNAVGTRATDFLFSYHGRVRSLYSVEAELLLLVFGNPECTACRELHASLEEMDEGIRAKVTVLEINPDEDTIAKAELDQFYHIRAIPSMYLLDKDKVVILKDAPVERILKYLDTM